MSKLYEVVHKYVEELDKKLTNKLEEGIHDIFYEKREKFNDIIKLLKKYRDETLKLGREAFSEFTDILKGVEQKKIYGAEDEIKEIIEERRKRIEDFLEEKRKRTEDAVKDLVRRKESK